MPAISSASPKREALNDPRDGVEREALCRLAPLARQGYFVFEPGLNFVVCPSGRILRQKSVKRSGVVRFANKAACSCCADRCVSSPGGHKELDVAPGHFIMPTPVHRHDLSSLSLGLRRMLLERLAERYGLPRPTLRRHRGG